MCEGYLSEALVAGSTEFSSSGNNFPSCSCRHHLRGQDCDWAVSTYGGGDRGLIQSIVLAQRYYVQIRCGPAVPAPRCRADMGMVLIMVVPCLEDPGAMPRMVGLVPAA